MNNIPNTPIDPAILRESQPLTYEQFVRSQEEGAKRRAEQFAATWPAKAAEGDDRADWRTYVAYMEHKTARLNEYVRFYNQWLELLPHGYEYVLTVYALLSRELVWNLYDIATDYQMDKETHHYREFLDQLTDVHYFGGRIFIDNKVEKRNEIWVKAAIEMGLLTKDTTTRPRR